MCAELDSHADTCVVSPKTALIIHDYETSVAISGYAREVGQQTCRTVTGVVAYDAYDGKTYYLHIHQALEITNVMAILLFGRPLSELDAGEGQTGGQLVQTALVAAAGSQVEDALGTALVDSVRYDSDDGLALGWSIGTDAFLTVAVDPTAETEENLTEARLSWFLGGAGEAEVQTGDAGVSEAWLRVEERF